MKDDSLWVDDGVDDLADVAPARRRATRKKASAAPAQGGDNYDKFPRFWALRMKDANVGAFKIALLLLLLRWKAKGKPVIVSDAAAAERGVGHRRKISAILELEKLGLIRVKRRPKKSSLITVLLPRWW
jgi:hypothetical protein